MTTINEDGSRNFLHPADVSGRYTTARRVVAWLLVVVYFALPFIPVNGHPAVFLDTAAGRFHFMGQTIASQDFWILFFLVTGLGFSLFVITALFGRIWCGWACPQTVFMEHIFRRIERRFEGDHLAQRKLDALPWSNPEKWLKRGGKLAVFFLITALIAHFLLAYFISIPELYGYMTQAPAEHWDAFVFVGVTTLILFFNFTWFREQLCIVICPYGRFQSALIDDDSLVIGYDEARGEPRGPAKNPQSGHCIDCNRCVQVCPTGIDIRQGLQMECIGCANCIDACDAIMDKLKRPRGLIRYDSLNGFESKRTRWLRPRVLLYAALMLIGATVMTFSLSRIKPVYLNVTRMSGVPFYVDNQSETIRNQYQIRLINKRNEAVTYQFQLEGAPEGIEAIGLANAVTLAPMEERTQTIVLRMAFETYPGKFSCELIARDSQDSVTLRKPLRFIGPARHVLQASEAAPKSVD